MYKICEHKGCCSCFYLFDNLVILTEADSEMLRTTPALSYAILKLCSAKSLASAKPSLTAIASNVSGFDIPITTTDEAPRN
jgi:hypothetical protein